MGLDMPLREAMETQRAIRRLKPDPVDDEVIMRCIELALKAPTGSNAQNWEWIVVRDREVKANLARFYREAWTVYGTARAQGLGAALTTLPLWSVTRARSALGLPYSVTPCAVIPVGWPRGRYGPT